MNQIYKEGEPTWGCKSGVLDVEVTEYRETLSGKYGYQVKNGDALKSWITSGKANKFQKSYLKHINNCEKLASKFEGKDISKDLVHKVLEE